MLTRADIQRVQSLQQKKFRQKYGMFRAEGDKLVRELLASSWEPEAVYATEAWWADEPAFVARLGERAVWVTKRELDRMSDQRNPHAALAIAALPEADSSLPSHGWILALDRIRDPGNMGTLLRLADWFGAAVCCSPDCVDRFNTKVIQASMGSLFRVPVVETPLAEWLTADLRSSWGADMHGTPAANVAWPAEGILVVGNEAAGLDEALPIQNRVVIPGGGGAESLNAGVAAGILLAAATGAV